MATLITELSQTVTADDRTYKARVHGRERRDGTWEGWLEFVPATGNFPALTTEPETSQPDRKALDYWSTGLEKIYLEGALDRAMRRARSKSSSSPARQSGQGTSATRRREKT
jgi:hypothetical protein